MSIEGLRKTKFRVTMVEEHDGPACADPSFVVEVLAADSVSALAAATKILEVEHPAANASKIFAWTIEAIGANRAWLVSGFCAARSNLMFARSLIVRFV